MIQELMIINQAGIALFYHSFIINEKIDDEQSIAGYFDVICRFTKQSFKESLKTLELDSFIFFFYTHKSNYHLVLKCKKKLFDKKILESVSEKIIDKFIEKYKEVLQDFNGEISHFTSFSEDIVKILASKFEEFKKFLTIEQ
ncbi:unnamed protein product [marine sediment metagenome]|uniref:FUZ/MON1/HPS1 first Longin domain-containing protein n=1 Tax=marine sediment metagenome TaxID=412755 RepID=X1LKP0_9ZZZZ